MANPFDVLHAQSKYYNCSVTDHCRLSARRHVRQLRRCCTSHSDLSVFVEITENLLRINTKLILELMFLEELLRIIC